MSDTIGTRTHRDQLRHRLEQERAVEVSRLNELHAPGPQRPAASDGPNHPGGPAQGPRPGFGAMVRGEQRLAQIARALANVDGDMFGRCQECGSLIDPECLAEQPLRDHCWRCAAQ